MAKDNDAAKRLIAELNESSENAAAAADIYASTTRKMFGIINQVASDAWRNGNAGNAREAVRLSGAFLLNACLMVLDPEVGPMVGMKLYSPHEAKRAEELKDRLLPLALEIAEFLAPEPYKVMQKANDTLAKIVLDDDGKEKS